MYENILSEKVFTGKEYLELLTGNYYIKGDTQNEIEHILACIDYEVLWSFPLDEIDEVIENGLKVVLVQCSKEENYTEYEYRWFELPNNISKKQVEKFLENTMIE